jgi:hypothetical protein
MMFLNTRVSETDIETAEGLGFIRQQRERELAKDPVRYYKLTAADGSTRGDVLECHESHAAALNEARMWRYLNSQRQREADRLAREAKRQNEARIERYLADVTKNVVSREIPLPPARTEWQQELMESHKPPRTTHKKAQQVESELVEPPTVWNSDDYLWTRVIHPSGPIVTAENTAKCKHD